MNELKEQLQRVSLSNHENDLIENVIKNSTSINMNGQRAAGIVSRLLDMTRKGGVT